MHWDGVLKEALGRYNSATSDVYRQNMEALMEEAVCPSCHGSRIKPYPSAAKIQGKTIAEITNLPIEEAAPFFKKVPRNTVTEELLKRDPAQAGVSAGRWTRLSHARSQRRRRSPAVKRSASASPPRSAQDLSARPTFWMSPPSACNPIDNNRLLNTLKALRDQGNTVIVVEHDAETIFCC